MDAPTAPPTDTKDWTWVLSRPCPDCGYDAAALDLGELPRRVDAVVDALVARLDGADAAVRPAPTVWSPLEYACHVRDVARLAQVRLRLMLDQDDPLFANWDQDATALDDRYWTQPPAQVAQELRAAARGMTAAYAAVTSEQLGRRGRRSDGAVFTVDSLARYILHDLVHHEWDVAERR
jgi:hypothetical protein